MALKCTILQSKFTLGTSKNFASSWAITLLCNNVETCKNISYKAPCFATLCKLANIPAQACIFARLCSIPDLGCENTNGGKNFKGLDCSEMHNSAVKIHFGHLQKFCFQLAKHPSVETCKIYLTKHPALQHCVNLQI